MKRLRCACACVVVLVWALLAGPLASAAPVTVRDDAGHVLSLPAPAHRVVALAPHLAELVFDAGAGERLVGVMRYSDFPQAVSRLPVVGDAFAVNLEVIASLKPDLLLMWSSGVNPRQQQRLQTLGVTTFDSEIGSIEALGSTLRRLGTLFGTEAIAEAAAQRAEGRWQALKARYAQRRPVRVFYQLWHEPLMTVNRQHLIAQAIEACGGINVFGQQPLLTPTISWEAAVAADPQVVITGAGRDEPARLEAWQRFGRVEAVKRGLVIALDGEQLARMTPRFIDAAQSLCEAIDRARR
ncbi:cobalamin-binding protein [Aquabacterium sp.]|uniref:cobalamin-binding protein n=1 Tax=Aquabacterium sp. TaxID=1872578 RepID=UPI0037851038